MLDDYERETPCMVAHSSRWENNRMVPLTGDFCGGPPPPFSTVCFASFYSWADPNSQLQGTATEGREEPESPDRRDGSSASNTSASRQTITRSAGLPSHKFTPTNVADIKPPFCSIESFCLSETLPHPERFTNKSAPDHPGTRFRSPLPSPLS